MGKSKRGILRGCGELGGQCPSSCCRQSSGGAGWGNVGVTSTFTSVELLDGPCCGHHATVNARETLGEHHQRSPPTVRKMTARYGLHTHTHTEPRAVKQSSDINGRSGSRLQNLTDFDSIVKQYDKKSLSHKHCMNNWTYTCKKKKKVNFDPGLTPYAKTNPK